MFQRIIVPLDGSSRAEQALPVAACLARANGGTLVLLQVVNTANEFVAYATLEPIPTQITINAAVTEAKNYLKQVAATSDLSDIQTETAVVLGQAAATILATADSYNSDLIVMCSHGYTGMRRWALGSVVANVVHHATMPILLLRDGEAALVGSHAHEGSLRILVPLDGSPQARAVVVPAAHLIAALAGPARGILHLTQVVAPPHTGRISLAEREIMVQEIERKLRATTEEIGVELTAAAIPNLKLPATCSLTLDEDVASGIINVAENGEDAQGASVFGRCDVIAMATHGRGAFQRWLMGSVTERVLHASKLPLLIVRPPDSADKNAQV